MFTYLNQANKYYQNTPVVNEKENTVIFEGGLIQFIELNVSRLIADRDGDSN